MTNRDKKILPNKDRRSALILAAYHSIAEKGFEGFRLHEIAAHVGLNHATVYHYFPTKEAVIHEVVIYVGKHLAELTTASTGTPAEQLRHHLTRLMQIDQQDAELAIVLAELALRGRRDQTTADAIQQQVEGWHTFLVGILQAGVEQGTWPKHLDTHAVASTIIALMGVAGSSQSGRKELAIHQLMSWLQI